jgi:type VI protein secretion system component VasK
MNHLLRQCEIRIKGIYTLCESRAGPGFDAFSPSPDSSLGRRVENITVSAIERLQRNMEASRSEAADRFLSRLREQLAPLLEDAQVTFARTRSSVN